LSKYGRKTGSVYWEIYSHHDYGDDGEVEYLLLLILLSSSAAASAAAAPES
jgi:hypothetical protein